MEQNPTGQGGQQQPVQPPQQPMQSPAGQQQPKKSNTNTVLIIVAVVVVLGLVMIVGGYFVVRSLKAKVSQKVGQTIGENLLEKAIEQGTGQKADVSADGKTVSIKTDDGTFATSETGTIKLPADFPSDVFTYPDAKITFAISTPANAASGTTASYIVSYSVNQSPADVVAKYKAEMVKNGWTVGTEANYGSVMVNFEKGNKEVAVAIGESQDGKIGTTEVSVTGSER
jgi:cytoskeletal protein RodZ